MTFHLMAWTQVPGPSATARRLLSRDKAWFNLSAASPGGGPFLEDRTEAGGARWCPGWWSAPSAAQLGPGCTLQVGVPGLHGKAQDHDPFWGSEAAAELRTGVLASLGSSGRWEELGNEA